MSIMEKIQTPLQVGCYTVSCGPRPYDLKDFPNFYYHFVNPVHSHISSPEIFTDIILYLIWNCKSSVVQVAE